MKAVSKASLQATNPRDREEIVQNVIASRAELPTFENKKQFRMKWNFQAARCHEEK